MKSKVTLKELVGTKIIYALLLACYYWMWARRDWQDFYAAIQHTIVIFSIIFLALQAARFVQYGKQEKDEQARQNLRRTDTIVLKIVAVADIVIAFASAVAFLDETTVGYALIGTIFVSAVIRLLLFCAMERKEA